MSNDFAIKAENLSKCYPIFNTPRDRLKQMILPRLQRLLGARVKKYYREFWALHDVSFEVKRGESLGIVGRNGSGKSTLLQIISGTLSPTRGEVQVNGRVAALLELGSGFNPEFTGRENVYLNASVLGLSHKEIDERFEDIAAFADIGDFLDQPIKSYSSGMTMRLAFSVIAHVNADILIVDEALAVGDVFFVQKCMRFIRKFQESGTLLLVTHDTSALQSLCQQALWLNKGATCGRGSVKDVAEDYLAATYAEEHAVVNSIQDKQLKENKQEANTTAQFIDQRAAFINNSNLRNDIEVFQFNPNCSGFGAGGAVIEAVHLLDAQTHSHIKHLSGGEYVILSVGVKAKVNLKSPVVGFFLKNHFGQCLFGCNTYLTYKESPIIIKPFEIFTASFRFQMPYIPPGDYMFAVACADGTQSNHIQHHYLHEALSIKSHSSNVTGGLIGLPILEINILRQETYHEY
jgi:lipopolysaccharide transport system ATP-binding protein